MVKHFFQDQEASRTSARTGNGTAAIVRLFITATHERGRGNAERQRGKMNFCVPESCREHVVSGTGRIISTTSRPDRLS